MRIGAMPRRTSSKPSSAAAAAVAVVLGVVFRRFWRAHPLLGFGLALLVTFVAIRAISFHRVDIFIGTTIAGVRMNDR